MKKIIIILVIFLIAFVAYKLWLRSAKPEITGISVVVAESHTYLTDVATSTASHAKGLSGRKNLDHAKGMLFLFSDSDERAFWMKGMNFPLDIIWINKGQITGFSENAQPDQNLVPEIHSSNGPADMVLEINAGEVKEKGIQVGDSVKVVGYNN